MKQKLREIIKDELKTAGIDTKSLDALADAHTQQSTSPWFRYFLSHDPRPALAKVRCPILAMNGAKDLQVPCAKNLSEIEKAANANTRKKCVELSGLNHLFQECTTGLPAEYGQIAQTFSPVALNMISDWISALKK